MNNIKKFNLLGKFLGADEVKLAKIELILNNAEQTAIDSQKPETVEVKLEEITLADGKKIYVDPAIEIGATVNEVMEDGTQKPLADGEYQIDTMIIVVKDGKIIEAKVNEETIANPAPAQTTEPAEENAQPAQTTEQTNQSTVNVEEDKIAVISERVAKLEETIMNFINVSTEKFSKLDVEPIIERKNGTSTKTTNKPLSIYERTMIERGLKK